MTGKIHLPASINQTPGRKEFLDWLRFQPGWGIRAASSIRSNVSVIVGPTSETHWFMVRSKLLDCRAWPYTAPEPRFIDHTGKEPTPPND